jgi:hypothetical protein
MAFIMETVAVFQLDACFSIRAISQEYVRALNGATCDYLDFPMIILAIVPKI